MDVAVYHNPCSDGIASAWLVKQNYPNIQLIGCKAGENPNLDISSLNDKIISFLDICPKLEYLKLILNICKKVIILDHHESNYKEINQLNPKPDNLIIVFDNNRSGCMITYDYIHNTVNESLRPWFINYIGDRDLWQFKLENSKNINLSLFNDGYLTLAGLSKLNSIEDTKTIINEMALKGKIYSELMDKQLDISLNQAKPCYFKDINDKQYNTYLISNIQASIRSDVCNKLLTKPFINNQKTDISVYLQYDIESNEFWLSFRSNKDGINLADLLKPFGGGGHACASGLTVKTQDELKKLFTMIKQ